MRPRRTGQTSFNIMRGIMRTLAGWQRRRTRPAVRGSCSHNPHYVLRPRVQPLNQCHAQQLAGARSCRLSGGVLPQRRSRRHPWRLRCRSAAASSCGSQSEKGVGLAASACKGFMPARRRLAAAARAAQKGRASLVPASPASAARPGPVWSCKGQLRSGSGATERRSVACGLSAARTRRPRAVAPPCRRRRPGGPPSRVAGNGLSGKRNDRFVAVVIW